jgi:hypothetical protein
MASFREGEPKMRIVKLIFVGSIASLAVLAAPALAKNSNVPKTDDNAASLSCHAYQQAADGSWTQLPCQETGAPAQGQQPKSATRKADEPTRTR